MTCKSIQVFDGQGKHNLALGGETLVSQHSVKALPVVDHQVCTHLRMDFVSLLFVETLSFYISRVNGKC